jgi:hypothetical protein
VIRCVTYLRLRRPAGEALGPITAAGRGVTSAFAGTRAAAILGRLGVRSVALMTNNPDMIGSLTRHGVPCYRVLPMASR